MLRKHLFFMGLALSVGVGAVSAAQADGAAGVTPVSASEVQSEGPQYSDRPRTPIERLFAGFGSLGRWSTRRDAVSVAAVQTTSEASVAQGATSSTPPVVAPATEPPVDDQSSGVEEDAGSATAAGAGAVPEASSASEEDNTEGIDIYAPRKEAKKKRFKAKRHAGDTDVILVPAARPLEEGQVNVSLDELLLWRAQLGVTDDFMLEANSIWGFSIGVNGKYALVREGNTAVAVQFGAGAFTVEKRMNWSHASLLYSKDMGRGAVHAGAHLVYAHTPDGESYVVPEATAGAEVALMKRVRALTEIGFGSDVLQQNTSVANNTGFLNLGLRLDLSPVYFTGGLVIPMNEAFLDSPALGVPFVRLGATF